MDRTEPARATGPSGRKEEPEAQFWRRNQLKAMTWIVKLGNLLDVTHFRRVSMMRKRSASRDDVATHISRLQATEKIMAKGVMRRRSSGDQSS